MFQVDHHASKATKLLKTVLIVFLVFAAVPVASLVTSPDVAHALCETDGMYQTWLNVDPDTRGIRRVEIFFPCDPEINASCTEARAITQGIVACQKLIIEQIGEDFPLRDIHTEARGFYQAHCLSGQGDLKIKEGIQRTCIFHGIRDIYAALRINP